MPLLCWVLTVLSYCVQFCLVCVNTTGQVETLEFSELWSVSYSIANRRRIKLKDGVHFFEISQTRSDLILRRFRNELLMSQRDFRFTLYFVFLCLYVLLCFKYHESVGL